VEQLLTKDEQAKVEEILPLLKMKMLARQITGNEHFEAILADAKPAMRRQVYEQIVPHILFKPKAFIAMKFHGKKRKKYAQL